MRLGKAWLFMQAGLVRFEWEGCRRARRLRKERIMKEESETKG